MTVPVADQLEYISDADGVTKDYPYPTRFLQKDEIVVVLRDADGIDTPQYLNQHFSIAGSTWPNGGLVSFYNAPPQGMKVVRSRQTQAKQTVDLGNKQRNDAEAVELQLDRLTMAIQDRGQLMASMQSGLRDEVAARVNADKLLHDKVDQEILDRENADKALASLIGDIGSGDAPLFDTVTAVSLAHIDPLVNAIHIAGGIIPGDGDDGLYVRASAEPVHTKKVQSEDGSWWELASFKQSSITAVPRTITNRLRDTVSALDFYQPTDNGISHAVNRAIDFIASRRDDTSDTPKGAVILPNLGENYLVTTPIVLKSYVVLTGIGNPTLKLANGAAGNVIESENFWVNKGTGGTSGDPGIRSFELSGFTIDGNRKLCPAGEYGVAAYGRDCKISSLRIRDAKKWGVFTQWRGGNVDSVYPFTSWEMESCFYDIKVLGSGQGGFAHHGAHDSRAYGIVCMHNGMDFAEHVQSLVSGGMDLIAALAASSDQPRYAAILIGSEGGGGYGFHLTDCHTWGRYNSYGVKVDVSGVSLSGNQFEGAYDAQVGIFAPRSRMSGNLMYCGSGNDYWQPNPVGLEVGAGVSTLLMDDSNAFSSVKTVIKKTGASSGLNKIAGTIYSSDAAARIFGGSGSWSPSDRSDMAYEGGITAGSPKPATKFDGNIRGTWLPTVSFENSGTLSVTYTKQAGSWTRIGDRILLSVELAFSVNSYTGASGSLRISLPFDKSGSTLDSVDIGRFANLTLPAATNDLSPKGYATQGNKYFGVAQPVDGGALLFLGTSAIPPNTSNIIIEASGHYTVA